MAHILSQEPDMIGVQAIYSNGKLVYKESRAIDTIEIVRKHNLDRQTEIKDGN
jgi:hypothetical protein